MTRRMSCSMTIDAVRARTKTETRRDLGTWRTLKAGDRLTLIEKGMGLAKGEHQQVLCDVDVVSVTDERLRDITESGVAAEGFPHWTPLMFIGFWLGEHGYQPHDDPFVRVIRWEYL